MSKFLSNTKKGFLFIVGIFLIICTFEGISFNVYILAEYFSIIAPFDDKTKLIYNQIGLLAFIIIALSWIAFFIYLLISAIIQNKELHKNKIKE